MSEAIDEERPDRKADAEVLTVRTEGDRALAILADGVPIVSVVEEPSGQIIVDMLMRNGRSIQTATVRELLDGTALPKREVSGAAPLRDSEPEFLQKTYGKPTLVRLNGAWITFRQLSEITGLPLSSLYHEISVKQYPPELAVPRMRERSAAWAAKRAKRAERASTARKAWGNRGIPRDQWIGSGFKFTAFGREWTINEAAQHAGVHPATLRYRLRNNWDPEDAMAAKPQARFEETRVERVAAEQEAT